MRLGVYTLSQKEIKSASQKLGTMLERLLFIHCQSLYMYYGTILSLYDIMYKNFFIDL